jgi:hypothetical protein
VVARIELAPLSGQGSGELQLKPKREQMKETTRDIVVREVQSPYYKVTAREESAFEAVRTQRWNALREELTALASRPAQQELSALQQEITQALELAIPDLEARRERYLATQGHVPAPPPPPLTAKSHLWKSGDECLVVEPFVEPGVRMYPFRDPGVISLDPENIGTFWWAQTRFFSNGMSAGSVVSPFSGINVELADDGHFHFFGDAHREGSFIVGSVGAISDFAISPERLPLSDKRKFRVRPRVRALGIASGSTGTWAPILHWDDKICKCNMVIRATLLMSRGDPHVPEEQDRLLAKARILDTFEQPTSLIELRNEYPHGHKDAPLNFGCEGNLVFDVDSPVVGGNLQTLAATGTYLLFQLEVSFFFDLQGDAEVSLRLDGGSAASLENSVIVKLLGIDFEPYSGLPF